MRTGPPPSRAERRGELVEREAQVGRRGDQRAGAIAANLLRVGRPCERAQHQQPNDRAPQRAAGAPLQSSHFGGGEAQSGTVYAAAAVCRTAVRRALSANTQRHMITT